MIQLHISTAGISGNPYKLLVLESKNYEDYELFNSMSTFNWEFYWAAVKLLYRAHKKRLI